MGVIDMPALFGAAFVSAVVMLFMMAIAYSSFRAGYSAGRLDALIQRILEKENE